MAFEIRYPNGEAVSTGTLEVDARVAWNIPGETLYEPGAKKFASPLPEDEERQHSWWHIMELAIDPPKLRMHTPRLQPTWRGIKEILFRIQTEDLWESSNIRGEINNALDYLDPYYHLFDYWEKQGYIPVKTNSNGL